MPDLNTTWWDLLQRIAYNLNWSYAALWTLTDDGRNLIWKEGYYHMRNNDGANAELFHSLYSSCVFTPGVGFAGHALANMTNSILWLSGDELDRLERPVANQTRFLQAAGIQTVVCLPLGLPSSSYVLELGTVSRVRETDDLAHEIKRVLLHLLAHGLQHIINDKAENIAHQPAADLFRGQVRAFHENPHHPPMPAAIANEDLLEPTRTHAMNFSLEQRQLGLSNIYSELLHSLEHEETVIPRHVGRGILNAVPPQLSVEVPELTGSTEPSPAESLPSPWAIESSMSQMELNSFQSWTSMAEATSALDVTFRGLPGTSSATSLRLAQEIADPNDEIEQMVPFSTTLEQFMAAADQQQQQQNLISAAAGASLRGSSSLSSMSLKSQNVEDSEISSRILDTFADHHISDLENVSHGGGHGGGSSSTTPMPGAAQLGSGPSSCETSPESNVIPPRRSSYGIHPRISSNPSSPSRKRLVDMLQQHGGKLAATSHELRPLDRQRSNSSDQNQQQEDFKDLKPGPSIAGPDNSALRLVQFGNVLQLGNAAGQVTEALPQEHDEAAVSHMLAERRRRNKQNENFSQLKFLIPSAGKMDKASVLAATIAHIHELKERVRDLEQSNQSLKSQLLSAEQDQTSTGGGPLLPKGSPNRGRVRTPNSLSPTEEDKIHVSLEGDSNLTIEIRSACNQPDTATQIFACLKEKQLKVTNFKFAMVDNRIHANIAAKMKRKNSAGQSAVCAELEQALAACLNNSG